MNLRFNIFIVVASVLCFNSFAEDVEGDAPKPAGEKAPPPTAAVSTWSGVGKGTLQPGKYGITLPPNAKVMIIPIDDEKSTSQGYIDHWQAAFVERRLKRAAAEKFDLVVLEINTNGGRVDACERINEAVAACPVPVIAFSGKAISGGAI